MGVKNGLRCIVRSLECDLRWERKGELYVTVTHVQQGFEPSTWESDRHDVRRGASVTVSDSVTFDTESHEPALLLVNLWEWDGEPREKALKVVTAALKSAPVSAALGGSGVARALAELTKYLSGRIRRPDLLASREIRMGETDSRRKVLVSGNRGEAEVSVFRVEGSSR